MIGPRPPRGVVLWEELVVPSDRTWFQSLRFFSKPQFQPDVTFLWTGVAVRFLGADDLLLDEIVVQVVVGDRPQISGEDLTQESALRTGIPGFLCGGGFVFPQAVQVPVRQCWHVALDGPIYSGTRIRCAVFGQATRGEP